jgi:hypothetical protein
LRSLTKIKMKILSVGLARALWFVDINELNPAGKDIFTHLFPSLLERYKFKTLPKQGDDLAEGMKFSLGEWVKADGTVLPLNITIFKDGIAADTRSSTNDSEQVLETALGQLPELGFAYDPEMIRRKAYLSQLNVKCSKQLHTLNPGLIEFARQVSVAVGGIKFDMAAIELWPDQGQTLRPANFSFQRKIGECLDGDRYWSQAAVPTEKHIALLEQMEMLLSE